MNTTVFYFNALHEQLNTFIQQQNDHIAIVTDSNVAPLHAKTIFKHIKSQHPKALMIEIPAGESSKTREIKSHIEDRLMEENCNRCLLLIAIGGGVITDLTGFIAATFNRGVEVIYIPTTLLCMADAAIGGKTAVNTPFGKNLIGAFHSPKAVFIEPEFLLTLDKSQYISAFAEVLKHAFILDREYYVFLKEQTTRLLARNSIALNHVIKKSIEIKTSVVQKDQKENGLRAILNFGHTIGHAIEKAANFNLPHGDAVSIGMYIEASISQKMGLLPLDEFNKIKTILQNFSLPLKSPVKLEKDKLNAALKIDKKRKNQTTRFVLLKSIGEAYVTEGQYTHAVPSDILESLMNAI